MNINLNLMDKEGGLRGKIRFDFGSQLEGTINFDFNVKKKTAVLILEGIRESDIFAMIARILTEETNKETGRRSVSGDEGKRPLLDRCPVKIVDGHFEHDCETKEDLDELAAIYEREAILRIKPAESDEEGGK